MRYFSLGNKLPGLLSVPLFVDRNRFGLKAVVTDPCWNQWQKVQLNFYSETQKKSVGNAVNSAGYNILKKIDLSGKRVLEIGPGDFNHLPYWKGRPEHYVVADVSADFLNKAQQKLEREGISNGAQLLRREDKHLLPFDNGSFDILLSFYSFEHLHPLPSYLNEIARILKNEGMIVGAIPSEGGLAWGLGRYLTSRRWLLRNTTINPDKIICWEHPNFASEILRALDRDFYRSYLNYWPLRLPLLDSNLVIKFIYQKKY